MIDPEDMEICRGAIRTGSKSFFAASKLLPPRIRDRALALYAFCRVADDAVDEHAEKADAVLRLRARLDSAYAGRPDPTPIDRAFAAMAEETGLPKALPEALIEGFAWDAMGRRYDSISEVRAYAARVAAAVGAMMTVIMGVRDRHALARACDLGVAMQLTNIARDVGEDARAGRLYLPQDWLREEGIAPERFLADPGHSKALARVVKRLLGEARRFYFRAEAGITVLPLTTRPGIFAARLIYAEIGARLRDQGYDSFKDRARTGTARKVVLAGAACGRAAASLVMPQSAVLYASVMPECAFLVEAAARDGAVYRAETAWDRKLEGITATLMELQRRDRDRSAA